MKDIQSGTFAMNIDNIFRKNILFQGLSENDFQKLLSISKEIVIKEGDYLILEGEVAKNFYLILEGNIAITKLKEQQEHVIAWLRGGDTVGEIALLDDKARSASAKAVTRTKLLCIQFDELEQARKKWRSLDRIFVNVTKTIGGRLRQANLSVVEALDKQLNEYKIRTRMGLFMVNIITALCGYTFLLSWLTNKTDEVVSSTAITLPALFAFLILFVLIAKGSGLPRHAFGITTQNWRKAVAESLILTSILCAMTLLLKWILIHVTQTYAGHSLFELYSEINVKTGFYGLSPKTIWWMIFLLYCLLVAPTQELFFRGGLQGALEVFLTGKNAALKAIIVSNLIFSATHINIGTNVALLAFLGGLYFGWLYSRHHTLIGVILAHALIGTWALMVVGF